MLCYPLLKVFFLITLMNLSLAILVRANDFKIV